MTATSRTLPLPEPAARWWETGSRATPALLVAAVASVAAVWVVHEPSARWACGMWALALAAVAFSAERHARQVKRLSRHTEHLLAQVHRHEARWQDLEVMAPVARFEWLPDGDRWWGDAAFYRLLGLTPSTLPTSTGLMERHVDPDDRDQLRVLLDQASAEGGWLDGRLRMRREDGTMRHVRMRARQAAGGQVRRLTGVLLDQTDALRVADELRAARFALDQLDLSVSVVDDDHYFRLHNRAWFAVTGVARRPPSPIHFEHVFPLVTSPPRRAAFDACRRDGGEHVVRGHNPAAPYDGQVYETRYIRYDDPDASWRGILMVSRNVTPVPSAAAGDGERGDVDPRHPPAASDPRG